MTEQTPAPSPETPGLEPAKGRNTKRLAIIGVSAVAVVAIAGGAFAAYSKLSGGGAQPHDVLPASVIGYARVDADPSASQKIALLKLIRKFPDAAESIGIKSPKQDVRKLIFDEILSETDCDLTYDSDIKPWIGSRFGTALEKDGETAIFAIQVTDEGKARKGIAELFSCGGEDKPGIAFLDGYAVVAEKQSIADKATKDAQAAPLAEDKKFVEDFDDLGDQGVASVWGDVDGVLKVPGLAEGINQGFTSGYGDDSGSLADLTETFAGVRSGALALRAGSSSLEVAGLAHSDGDRDDVDTVPIASLPKSTALAFSVSGGGAAIGKQWDTFIAQLEASGQGSAADLSGFEQATGFALPDDLKTLFGDAITIAVGTKNLGTIPSLSGPDDVAGLDIGIALTSDKDKAGDLARRIAALVGQIGVELAVQETDDGAVIATNDKAAKDLGGGGSLGDSSLFKQVVPDAGKATSAFYVDVAAILDALSEANPPDEVAEGLAEAKEISAFGFSTSRPSKQIDKISIQLAFRK